MNSRKNFTTAMRDLGEEGRREARQRGKEIAETAKKLTDKIIKDANEALRLKSFRGKI